MIPLGITGQVMSGVFQDIPAETASSQGISDFLLLFERALGIGVVAQTVDGTVSEDRIGMSDAAEAVATRTMDQGSSGVSDGKDQADRSIDPALAILIAALGRPQQATQALVDLQPPAVAAAPPVETTLQVAALSPSLSPQGARQMRESTNATTTDPLVVEQPTSAPAAILVEIRPLLRTEAATQQDEAPVMIPRPLLPPPGARVTQKPADVPPTNLIPVDQPTDSPAAIPVEIGAHLHPEAAAITAFPVQSGPLKGNASTHAKPDLSEEGAIPSATLGRASLSPPPRMALATEVQAGTSHSGGDQAAEQVGGLPPMVSSVEGSARTLVASSEDTAGRSSLPQHSAGWIATTSGPVKGPWPEVFEGEGSPERGQMGRADSDRVVMRQGSPRPEATQGMQQDRSASDSEGGSRSSDHSSPPPDNGRQIGTDFALAAGPRPEGPRSGSAAPPVHTGSLVDQVAEQVAEAARMSLRNEGGHVHLHLHPKALGELLIDISWKEGGIVAAIKAQSHIAGDLLASDLGRLRTALDKQGIPVSGLGVQVGLDLRHWSFEGNGFRPSPTIEYVRGTIPWRDRGSVPPNAVSMKTDSLIDITV